MNNENKGPQKGTVVKVSLDARPEFKGRVGAFLFDRAGNLRDRSELEDGSVHFSLSREEVKKLHFYLTPLPEGEEEAPISVSTMERLGAYSPVLAREELVRVPGELIDTWVLCLCWVHGRVVKSDSEAPVCNARVHICEVDKLPRWIIRLPDRDVFRLRDDLLKELLKPPLLRPPRPLPDPPPFELIDRGLIRLEEVAFNPQPEPPAETLHEEAGLMVQSSKKLQSNSAGVSSISRELRSGLSSPSPELVRRTLVDNFKVLLPYLCLWPWWWRFRCDEIAVLETDHFGRFHTVIPYLCTGDKPDLYFWIEYEIDSVWEEVYRPPIACYTYWNYDCGTEVTLRVSDDRVIACDQEPDLPGCVVQILSIGRGVSMAEIQGPGVPSSQEGLTTSDQPFGGTLEPRVWFSRSELRNDKSIRYYRWSYRRLTQGDGTPLSTPGPWTALKRTVVRHFAKSSPGGITHEPYPLGPQTVGSEPNLFEIKPAAVPSGGIEWTVVDERENLASGHFQTAKLGTEENACDRALNAAGKYELKLELFKDTGALVDWTGEGVDLQVTDVPAPFGTGVVTATTAPAYNRITDSSGHTVAFRMVVRVDNNCCRAELLPIEGPGLEVTPCGFIEFPPSASAVLKFKALHPNDFADFTLSVKRGVTDDVDQASASGRVGSSPVATDSGPHAYVLTGAGHYEETFSVASLLGPCTRAAYSEALHARTRATDGYHRLWTLDAFTHAGFALTPKP